jgi:hypothetical protein
LLNKNTCFNCLWIRYYFFFSRSLLFQFSLFFDRGFLIFLMLSKITWNKWTILF